MSDDVIRVENLGKKYTIRHQATRMTGYDTLRDVLSEGAKSLVRQFRRRNPDQRETQEEFWALKNISFDVKRGECIGIIGQNGAGKSTLLKILSRITEPTTGQIKLNGRVASLLEVGTGFHPELTGRENVYLNGAILGMSRAEIRKKFDEIVAFAEVEKFLDTPVKRYSSGMYVRLAFAVAAHLEPEILIVDEVLAVGDAAFQKRCLGKMKEVSGQSGRTVLFVSHNMSAVQRVCQTVILLKEGEIYEKSIASQVINKYLYLISQKYEKLDGLIPQEDHCHNHKGLLFYRIALLDRLGKSTRSIKFREELSIETEFEIFQVPESGIRLGIVISSLDGTTITAFHQTDDGSQNNFKMTAGKYSAKMQAKLDLMPGYYKVSLFAKPMPGFWTSQDYSLDYVDNALIFSVEDPCVDDYNYHTGLVLHSGSVVLPKSQWLITPTTGLGLS